MKAPTLWLVAVIMAKSISLISKQAVFYKHWTMMQVVWFRL